MDQRRLGPRWTTIAAALPCVMPVSAEPGQVRVEEANSAARCGLHDKRLYYPKTASPGSKSTPAA
jgi:hypothetical protein